MRKSIFMMMMFLGLVTTVLPAHSMPVDQVPYKMEELKRLKAKNPSVGPFLVIVSSEDGPSAFATETTAPLVKSLFKLLDLSAQRELAEQLNKLHISNMGFTHDYYSNGLEGRHLEELLIFDDLARSVLSRLPNRETHLPPAPPRWMTQFNERVGLHDYFRALITRQRIPTFKRLVGVTDLISSNLSDGLRRQFGKALEYEIRTTHGYLDNSYMGNKENRRDFLERMLKVASLYAQKAAHSTCAKNLVAKKFN